MKYATTIAGLTTCATFRACPESIEDQAAWRAEHDDWFNAHWRSRRIAGYAKPATVAKAIANLGIVRQIKAEAVAFDTSGKGRHIVHPYWEV